MAEMERILDEMSPKNFGKDVTDLPFVDSAVWDGYCWREAAWEREAGRKLCGVGRLRVAGGGVGAGGRYSETAMGAGGWRVVG